MKTEIIVLAFDHYQMEGNQGLNVRMLGEHVVTNNKSGLEVAKVPVPDYGELDYLKRFENDLPAKFKAQMSVVTVKDRGGNEKGGIALKGLEFVNTVEFIDKNKDKK